MKLMFKNLTEGNTQTFDEFDFIDGIEQEDVFKCLETDAEKVKTFFKCVSDESYGYDDDVYYRISLPDSDRSFIRIASGAPFLFSNYEFVFLTNYKRYLEKELERISKFI